MSVHSALTERCRRLGPRAPTWWSWSITIRLFFAAPLVWSV